MSDLNWLDSSIAFLAPQAALRRIQARRYIGLLRGYDGASKGRRTKGWKTISSSAAAETGPAIQTLRDRCRDLVRNNPYAAKAVAVIPNNVVGAGIVARVKSKNERKRKTAETLWKSWADTTACDAAGQLTLYGLQRLAMRCIAESGEVLIRRRVVADGSFPLRLQLLEPDFLDTTNDGRALDNGNRIIQGIEFDTNGRRVAYHLYDEHPGDAFGFSLRNRKPVRVPAEEIAHIYDIWRVGQIRGVPWGAPCILKMKDFDDYEDAHLLRQKMAAAYVGFIYDNEAGIPSPTGTGNTPEVPDTMQPGIYEILPPGKDIKFSNPPGVEGYRDYSTVTLHAIAAGFGVTYESLTGDYSNVNFSSSRMGWLEMSRNIDAWRWDMFIPMMCDRVWQWFVQMATISGVDMSGVEAMWTPPRREMIDPTKEVPAQRDAVRAGLKTLSEAIREEGFDPDEQFAELKEEQDKLKSLGITLDSISDGRPLSGTSSAGDGPANDNKKGQNADGNQ